MTEAEWLACDEPRRMLHWVTCNGPSGSAEADLARWRARPSDRKLRLFACACARVCVPEWFDGHYRDTEDDPDTERWGAGGALRVAGAWVGPSSRRGRLTDAATAALLRDVVGNPFRPAARLRVGTFLAEWAEAVYRDRAFDELPIIADYLADCIHTDADVVAHLRGPDPHVRGCWALDLVLGKS